ncbi:MAG: trehalose-phosphatase, partial [Diaphorobacter nitroreducens]
AQSLGGLGIKVGEGATRARARLATPAAVRQWLQHAVGEEIT